MQRIHLFWILTLSFTLPVLAGNLESKLMDMETNLTNFDNEITQNSNEVTGLQEEIDSIFSQYAEVKQNISLDMGIFSPKDLDSLIQLKQSYKELSAAHINLNSTLSTLSSNLQKIQDLMNLESARAMKNTRNNNELISQCNNRFTNCNISFNQAHGKFQELTKKHAQFTQENSWMNLLP